jgi:hypothetical protein
LNESLLPSLNRNATALREFVEFHYADDLALYARHCL